MRRKKLGMFQIRFKVIDRVLLAAMMLLVIATMFIFNAYANNAEKSQVDFVQLVMEKTSLNQKDQFEAFVEDKVKILKAMAGYPEIYGMDRQKQSDFVKNHSAKWGFRHIFIMDLDGIGFYPEEALTRNQGGEVFFLM